MSKTVISFDIGIKNLAYCVFTTNGMSTTTNGVSTTTNGVSTTIRDWGVINLLTTDATPEDSGPKCTCQTAKNGVCGKKAIFSNGENTFYCKTHSKNSGKILPSKETAMPAIKKLKMAELNQFCANHFISIGSTDKKPEILQKVQIHFEKITLKPIVKVKKANANQLHLVDIGKRIKSNFDIKFQPFMEELTHVVLENQISPIAGRMNTIQGMVAQYFVMQKNEFIIDFVSSVGKLKGLAINEKSTNEKSTNEKSTNEKSTNEKSTYKDHKKDGILFCKQFLESNPAFTPYKPVLEASAKKDDLADCFLQGIYYLKKQNIINYSDDLKIKTV
jgi:hypothetical protein